VLCYKTTKHCDKTAKYIRVFRLYYIVLYARLKCLETVTHVNEVAEHATVVQRYSICFQIICETKVNRSQVNAVGAENLNHEGAETTDK